MTASRPSRPTRGPALLVVVLAATLVLVAPSPAAALPALLHPSDDATSPLLAAVCLGAWACACWLLTCTALTAAGRVLPGTGGRAARALATRCAPNAMRRIAELAVGVTVATAVLGGTGAWAADGPGPATGVAPATAAGTTPVPTPQLAPALDLDWPLGRVAVADAAATSAPGAPVTGRADPRDRCRRPAGPTPHDPRRRRRHRYAVLPRRWWSSRATACGTSPVPRSGRRPRTVRSPRPGRPGGQPTAR